MITRKPGQAISMPQNASVGTAMLDKHRQMTQRQAFHSGKWGRADLHMHSTYSDGIGSIEQILHYVEYNTDLDVIALTDHDIVEGALQARDLWMKNNYRFDFIVGEEVSTREGHMLALFIEKHVPPDLSLERSIDLVHETQIRWNMLFNEESQHMAFPGEEVSTREGHMLALFIEKHVPPDLSLVHKVNTALQTQIRWNMLFNEESQHMAFPGAYFFTYDKIKAIVILHPEIASLQGPPHYVMIGERNHIQVGIILDIVQDLLYATNTIAVRAVHV